VILIYPTDLVLRRLALSDAASSAYSCASYIRTHQRTAMNTSLSSVEATSASAARVHVFCCCFCGADRPPLSCCAAGKYGGHKSRAGAAAKRGAKQARQHLLLNWANTVRGPDGEVSAPPALFCFERCSWWCCSWCCYSS